MKHTAILYTLLLALCSCGTARHTANFQRDSVVVTVRDSIILRDTVIQAEIPVEADKAVLPDTDTSRLRTSLAESEAFVKNGQLHHTLRNRAEMLLPVHVQYFDRAHSETTQKLAQSHTTETIEVELPINPWQRFRMTLGDALLIAAVIWAARNLAKLIR